ncbi:hypothetical protein IW261DRAFT_1558915 [Armillaria novae-zelandiae]|uniref:Uncharacterized protein n=1 Tax=Armillaria novae-zelandiae TaxID=153914 RepID=A0AA39UG16_9AGAR|nr:hypothetical protein IW261DRAFT_1558915 [Armillaria novae-zelandiae]
MDLVSELNELLTALRIPIPIQSPTDLTPSLLLAILECFLSSRLPLSPRLRHAAVSKCLTRPTEALNARVQCMKIFLGVLETDILKNDDLGLSGVDPRKLAAGEYAEVTLVAEALCWVGRQGGLVRAERDVHSPSEMTATTCISSLFQTGASVAESNTSISNMTATPEFSPRTPPRCIHEVPSPLALSLPLFNEEKAWGTSMRVPVGHTGTLGLVDDDWEVESFNSSGTHWSRQSHSSSDQSALYDSDYGNEHLRTVSLLKERARLLSEIARAQRKSST